MDSFGGTLRQHYEMMQVADKILIRTQTAEMLNWLNSKFHFPLAKVTAWRHRGDIQSK